MFNANENDYVCPECVRGAKENCEECCHIVERHCEKFGYQQNVACECHDICVQDVKLICVKERSIVIPIGGIDGAVGCRGGFEITDRPELHGCRIFCAEERLVTMGPDKCLVVENKVGVEVTLRIPRGGLPDLILVHRFTDEFDCRFTHFFTFPDGAGFENTEEDRERFRDIIKFIDGSCKTIIIEDCVVRNLECPRVEVELKVIDKLWKHENLLVSAIKPYPENITINKEFNELHRIGPCPPPCPV